jgi:hypothetical protein
MGGLAGLLILPTERQNEYSESWAMWTSRDRLVENNALDRCDGQAGLLGLADLGTKTMQKSVNC